MNEGRTVFAQLMDFFPKYEFDKCVLRYNGNRRLRKFSCYDQFLAMAFAQLTGCESLRGIETRLGAMQSKLYHMGLRGRVVRSTLADANEQRDWRIYGDFGKTLIAIARDLYADEKFALELDETVYALDATTVDLCLSLFPWAKFRKRKGAIKIHTLLDLRGPIPALVLVTIGTVHEVNTLDWIAVEPGSIYLMDRGYIDFARLHRIHCAGAFFLTRAKKRFAFRRLYSAKVDKSVGVQCDQTIALVNPVPLAGYPDRLRRVRFRDPETGKQLVFLTNNFRLPAQTIADLYKCRWQVELFFKWIKQHLRIKTFFGTSENAVKTQIWIAISVYVLVSIARKRMELDQSLYTILQILDVTLFEKRPILQVFSDIGYTIDKTPEYEQLNLFDF